MVVLYANRDYIPKLVADVQYNNQGIFAIRSADYQRFLASSTGVPIFSRTLADDTKVNNKINNDFVGDVIDTKLGYMISVPVTYTYEDLVKMRAKKADPNNVDIDSDEQTLIDDFVIENNIAELNLENLKLASICGTSFRLCYINEEGEPAAMVVNPWECMISYNANNTKREFAVRFYVEATVKDANSIEYTTFAEFYDDEKIYLLKTTATPMIQEGTTSIETFKFVEGYEQGIYHGFGSVPIIEYANNSERKGDCDKVLPLIDVYDRCLSDESSELEQFRLAYLALYGLDADTDAIAKMKQTGAFKMTVDGKVSFITKDINATAIENLLKQLEENIIRFSKSVNFTDKNFMGNLSGIAIKYKLIKLEHKCSLSELKMKKADLDMWRVLSDVFSVIKIPIDYKNIKTTFTRNLPINLLEEAKIQRELKGLVSTDTRLSLASFINNPKQEVKKMIDEVESGLAKKMEDFYMVMEEGTDSNLATGLENDEYNKDRKDRRDEYGLVDDN